MLVAMLIRNGAGRHFFVAKAQATIDVSNRHTTVQAGRQANQFALVPLKVPMSGTCIQITSAYILVGNHKEKIIRWRPSRRWG